MRVHSWRKKKEREGKERKRDAQHLAMLTRTAHARNTVFYNGPATSHVPIHRQSRRLFSLLDFPTILGEGNGGGDDGTACVGVGGCERFESFLTLKLVTVYYGFVLVSTCNTLVSKRLRLARIVSSTIGFVDCRVIENWKVKLACIRLGFESIENLISFVVLILVAVLFRARHFIISMIRRTS